MLISIKILVQIIINIFWIRTPFNDASNNMNSWNKLHIIAHENLNADYTIYLFCTFI